MVVSLGTGRLPVKAVDVYDVYRPEGVVDIAKVVFGAKNLAELFVDQVCDMSCSLALRCDCDVFSYSSVRHKP